ncbi:MAG: DUF937 domain-containing protein [Lachnospiraceae bacterium]|nr:DUF937 domain-containing protein [Lachnospiraceae bacterium]
MDLMKLAGTLLSSDSVDGVSERTGSSGSDVSKVLAKALPALLDGANDQAKGKKSSKGFASALSDHAKDDTSNLSKFLGNVDMEDGAKIIGHLLGSKEEDKVDEIAEEAGVEKADVLSILSAAAPLLLSLLGQQTEKEDKKEAVGDLVGVLLENVDVGSILTGLLTDKDSSKESTKKKSTAKKSSSSNKTKKSTTKKSSSGSTKKKTTSSTKKKTASDSSTGELVGDILKSLLK